MIIAVIQARLTSQRLPGKVLRTVAGKPLLLHMFMRLKESKRLDKIVVAIPSNEDNLPLRDFLDQHSILYILGDEHDVLSRYFTVTESWPDASIIVRLTGDCPLIDPKLVDMMIEKFISIKNCDYIRTGHSFADGQGVEVFKAEAIKKAHFEATESRDREHVTTYFKFYPESFKCLSIESEVNDSDLRYTVDTPADLKLVECIITHMNLSDHLFDQKDIRDFLRANPALLRINSSTNRNHIDGKI